MQWLRQMMLLLSVASALATVAGCQNTSGAAGSSPANCAMTGSSCSRSGR